MAALITTLIDKLDSRERVRDQIGAILLLEQANQQALATAAGKDPKLWDLRVFIERSNPWVEFQDADDEWLDAPPIVNVSLETASGQKSASDTVTQQTFLATYNIDCYGYGVAADDGATGHIPGDEQAAFVSARAARLVRNILMSAQYTRLGLVGAVGDRWVQAITQFQPQIDERAVQRVVGTRIAFEVRINEFAPEVVGETLEAVNVAVFRAETGELYFDADFTGDS